MLNLPPLTGVKNLIDRHKYENGYLTRIQTQMHSSSMTKCFSIPECYDNALLQYYWV